MDETNRESGKNSTTTMQITTTTPTTMPITTTEISTVLPNQINDTETGTNFTVAFNITFGVEVEPTFDPEVLNQIMEFLFDRVKAKLDKAILLLEQSLFIANYFVKLMGPLFGKWMTTKWQKLSKTFFKQKKEQGL